MLARLQLTQLTSAGFLNEWIALAELVDSLTQVHGPPPPSQPPPPPHYRHLASPPPVLHLTSSTST